MNPEIPKVRLQRELWEFSNDKIFEKSQLMLSDVVPTFQNNCHTKQSTPPTILLEDKVKCLCTYIFCIYIHRSVTKGFYIASFIYYSNCIVTT